MRKPDLDGTLDGRTAALATAWSRCVRGGCNLRDGQNAKEQKAIVCENIAGCLGHTAELRPGFLVLGLEISEREIHNRILHGVRKNRGEYQHLFGRVRVHSIFFRVTPELHAACEPCPEDDLFHAHGLAGVGREFAKLLNCVPDVIRRTIFDFIKKAEHLEDSRESLPVSLVPLL